MARTTRRSDSGLEADTPPDDVHVNAMVQTCARLKWMKRLLAAGSLKCQLQIWPTSNRRRSQLVGKIPSDSAASRLPFITRQQLRGRLGHDKGRGSGSDEEEDGEEAVAAGRSHVDGAGLTVAASVFYLFIYFS